MKTILTSNWKHKKIIFWLGLQGIGLLFLIGWIVTWVLVPNNLWLGSIFIFLSLGQICWTIYELMAKHLENKREPNQPKFSFLTNVGKYSYAELITNWFIVLWPILFLAIYIPIVVLYGSKLLDLVHRKTLVWPIPSWIMYILTFVLFLLMAMWISKWKNISKRNKSKNYKTIIQCREDRYRWLSSGTYDGTFDGVKKKGPKGFK
ncbi:MAG: hypothetical protein LBF00_01850 [Mycoplasmataceae bacterium]|jgi:hypothetical protein|nr:hypothetical protein [Mycoplasmataceae bacterium]